MVFATISGFMNRLLDSPDHNNLEQAQLEFDKKIRENMKIIAKAGHMVQSNGEKHIADYLWDHGIPYIYDTLIQVKGGWIRPDFILPKHSNLIIEFKGIDEIEYNLMFERKLQLLESAGLMALIIKPNDLQDIDRYFT